MNQPSNNEGIIISGGNINAEGIAIGRGAYIQKNIVTNNTSTDEKNIQDIINKLNEIVTFIKSNKDSVDNADELIGATEIIASEVSKEKPNKLTITTLLDGVANSFGSLTAITSSVIKLKNLIIASL